MDYSNLVSQAWQNVYDVVNNRTYVNDPLRLSTSTEPRKWVYSRDPNVKAQGFGGYPFIVVGDPGLIFGKRSVDRTTAMVTWEIEIEVVSSDLPSGENTERGASQNRTITDDIVAAFNSEAVKNIFLPFGMLFSVPENVDPAQAQVENNTLVYRRSIKLSFSSRKRLTA